MRHKLSALLPQPVRLQLAAAPQALSLEEFSALVDRVHEAHVVSPPQQTPAPACLCAVNTAAATDQPAIPADSLFLHVLQQQAAVTPVARRNPPLAAVPSSTESRLASVEASLRRLEALLAHSPTQTDAGACFYHRRFGEEARRCRPPCTWARQGNGAGGGQKHHCPSLPLSLILAATRCPAALCPPFLRQLYSLLRAPRNLHYLRHPLAPQRSMGGHVAPESPGRPTVAHSSSPPAKQRSRDGRAPPPPPSRLQPTGGRASAPPTHLRASAGHAPSQPSVGARHPYWPPAPPQPAEGFASVPPPGHRQPTPTSSDSPAPSPPPQHPEWFPASQRPLLWVRDLCSGARFLVDSGEEVSVVPAADTDRRAQPRTAYDLLAANRTPIATYGTQMRRVALLPGSRFPWAFVVADVEQAILGMDFLAAHDLLVDPRRRCLLHQPSATAIHAEPCAQPTPSLTTLRQATQFEALLQEFPLLTSPQSAPPRVQHGVQHSIVTTGPPSFVNSINTLVKMTAGFIDFVIIVSNIIFCLMNLQYMKFSNVWHTMVYHQI